MSWRVRRPVWLLISVVYRSGFSAIFVLRSISPLSPVATHFEAFESDITEICHSSLPFNWVSRRQVEFKNHNSNNTLKMGMFAHLEN